MSHVAARFALPLLTFAVALFLALFLSWWFFLPRLAGVPLHGKMMYGSSLVQFYADLRDRTDALEDARNQLVLPGQDSLSQFLHQLRRSDVSLVPLFAILVRSAEKAVPDRPDAVVFENFQYDAINKTLQVTGDVRNVGPRSMTVLAEFIETLRSIPVVGAVEHQRFTREEGPKGEFHSPFTVLLRFRSSSPSV
ncbi:hypothetical protein HY464_01960 [Candidatus Peregrinibacteria bacterium]|nr:hypothetical protein [Candidatus Peregrinibacteria bacterium]